jgi:predicted O-methyltransferase YrrM
MLPDRIFARIGNVPYMRVDQAKIFYEFIVENRLATCLELGFFHGVSTAYIAGALQDLGGGRLKTIDLATAQSRTPNIEWVLRETELAEFVEVYFEERSFNWRLMKFLELGLFEQFDMCYVNRDHSWYDTGLAFCLVERLLKPGGWVVFDDLHFSFRKSSIRDKPWVRRMPEEEQLVPQVERVFELLVETDPCFDSFRYVGQLGFARKAKEGWSAELRMCKLAEIAVGKAIERAGIDPEFRVKVLCYPARALSELSRIPEESFSKYCFVETDCVAPLSPETSEHGSTIVYLGPPTWERRVSEEMLENMLHN